VQLAITGVGNLIRTISRADLEAMPEDRLMRQVLRQCEASKVKPLVRYDTDGENSCWLFTKAGFALIHHWIREGKDSRDRQLSAFEMSELRHTVRRYPTKVRNFDLDRLRTK